MGKNYRNITKEEMIHLHAVRLLEGGHQWIEGHMLRAIKVYDNKPPYKIYSPCSLCYLDCICRGLITDVCNELDTFNRGKYILELV